MAKNEAKGHGRVGRIKERTQVHNPKNNRWIERNTKNGRFINVKADPKPFKDVRKEK